MIRSAEGATGAGDSSARNWQRDATRRAILDAARTLAARQGSTDFSLHSVAQEAGQTIANLFAYFQSKDELFNAVVADDLATVARQMRMSGMPNAPLPAASEPMHEQSDVQSAGDGSGVVAFAAAGEIRHDDVTKLPPRADAWLERRLRVFEKSLTDIETRLSTAQTDSSKALSLVAENTKIFSARLDASEKRAGELSNDLTTRLTAAEKRLRDSHSELRNNLLNASMRLDSLEALAQHATGGSSYKAPVLADPPPPEADEPDSTPPATPQEPEKQADTYLSTARRAAMTAAALAQMEKPARKRPAKSFWFNRKSAIIAAATVAAFVVGASVSYAVGIRDGRSTPIRVIAPPSATLQDKVASSTPLDRLSARARAGDATAELLIGLHYLKGQGVPIDQREAVKWISRAANSHNGLAQYWMGQAYEHGEGVTADAAEAMRWYARAADQGNREAMYDLGVAYAEGLGTQKNLSQGAHWFASAAALGLTNAQFNLAVLYERGEGVPASLREAYTWYAIAAAKGDVESRTRVDAIATQLPASELVAAKDAASSFRPGPLDRSANALPDQRSGA